MDRNVSTDGWTILHVIKHLAECRPDDEAFVFVSTNEDREVVTWKMLFVNSCRAAAGLINIGLKPREYVRLNMQNCPESLYAIYGILMAGAIPCFVFFCFQDGSDFLAIMEQLQTCSMLMVDPAKEKEEWEFIKQFIDTFSDNGGVTCPKIPYLRHIVCNEEGRTTETDHLKSIHQLIIENKHVHDVPLPLYDEVYVVFQTSGSIGKSKLVLQSHQVQRSMNFVRPIRYFSNRYFTSISGFPSWNIINGYTTITMKESCSQNKFELRSKIIHHENCKMMLLFPTGILEFIENQDELPSDWPVKVVFTGGQPLLSNVGRILGKGARAIHFIYATTECGLIAHCLADKNTFRPFCSGKIIPDVKVKIVDDAGIEQPVNTRGEIYVKTPTMFKGYVNNTKATEAAFDLDGWYKTGDIGLVTEDQELYVFGRKTNIILTVGSSQIHPEIIETQLLACDDVKDAVVVTVADEKHFQKMCACIIPVADRGLTEDKLRSQYEEKLIKCYDGEKCLIEYYLFFQSFPETINNKTSRRKLAEIAANIFTSSPIEKELTTHYQRLNGYS